MLFLDRQCPSGLSLWAWAFLLPRNAHWKPGLSLTWVRLLDTLITPEQHVLRGLPVFQALCLSWTCWRPSFCKKTQTIWVVSGCWLEGIPASEHKSYLVRLLHYPCSCVYCPVPCHPLSPLVKNLRTQDQGIKGRRYSLEKTFYFCSFVYVWFVADAAVAAAYCGISICTLWEDILLWLVS